MQLRRNLLIVVLILSVLLTSQQMASGSEPTTNNTVYAAGQVTGYKLPWPSGQTYMATGVRTSHTPYGNPPVPRQSIDFGTPWQTPVLAMKAGDIVYSRNIGGDTNGYVIIDHNDGYCSVYVHLSTLEFGTITSGRRAVVRGERIGLSGRLGTNGAIHLHVAVYTRSASGCGYYDTNDKQREQVIIFDEVGRELNYGDWVTSQNTPGSGSLSANENVIRNGTFSSGTDHWIRWGEAAWAVYSGVLAFKREANSPTGAAIQQELYVGTVSSGSTLEFAAYFGNSSSVTKEVAIRLHSITSWDGFLECVFSIPPNVPLRRYVMVGETGATWNGIKVEVYPNPADGIPDILMDNVTLKYYPTLDVTSTKCTQPSSKKSWDFTGTNGPQGWTLINSMINPTQNSDGMWYKVATTDPYMHSPEMLNVAASSNRYVIITMRSRADDCGQVFFISSSDSSWSEAKHKDFTINDDGATHTYVVDMSSVSGWTGNIRQIRIDPACNYNSSADNGILLISVQLTNTLPTMAMNVTAACNGPNLQVNITQGDGPFNVTASAGINMPVNGVNSGTTTINGPEKWDEVMVSETSGDLQSINLGQFKCRSNERPVLLSPLHRQHASDSTPTFGWTGISNANLYRLMLFDDSVVANRTVDIRQNTSGAETNLTLSQPLSVGRYFWRIRGRQNRVWSLWSTRFTLFIDPPTFTGLTPVPTVELAPPAQSSSPTPISLPGPVAPPTFPPPPNSR